MSTPTEHPEPVPNPATVSPAAPAPTDAGAKAKAKVSPARNAVSMILLVALVLVGGLELTALFRFNGAVNKLDAALENNEDDLIPRTEVEQILGKAADGPLRKSDPGMQQTTYTWHGAIRSHVLTAFYSYGETPGLVKYEIGDLEAVAPAE